MDWFTGTSTGNHRFSHEIWGVPVKKSLKPIHWIYGFVQALLRISAAFYPPGFSSSTGPNLPTGELTLRVFLIENALAMWNDSAQYKFHKLFHKPLTHFGDDETIKRCSDSQHTQMKTEAIYSWIRNLLVMSCPGDKSVNPTKRKASIRPEIRLNLVEHC